MKKIFLFFVCVFGINLHAQYYSLQKPPELKFLDLIIEDPKESSFFEEREDFNSKEFKIKSKLSDDRLTEYDNIGNIIREKDNLYDTKSTYTYKNKVLIEKKTITVANKENISKQEKEEQQEIERIQPRRLNNDDVSVVEKTLYTPYNKESFQTVDLDKNNRIISFSYKEYKTDINKKELISDASYNVSYSNHKISEIQSKNETEKYYYDKDLLVKKEYFKSALNLFSQDKKEIFYYHYDRKNNLMAIWRDETVSRNGTIDGHSYGIIDSANYDDKNRVIWKGSKTRFKTYKYDSKNNVIESSMLNGNKLFLKNEYQYNPQNQIIKTLQTHSNNEKEPFHYSKTFLYDKNLLKEIQVGNDSKTTFEYNESRDLIKVNKYRKPYPEKDKPEVEFRLESETKYTWGEKSLLMENRSSTLKYTFF